MKRDWEIVREVLAEVEAGEDDGLTYAPMQEVDPHQRLKANHALLLWRAGYLAGVDASTYDGPVLLDVELTWAGHDLLNTIRSQTVWERVKSSAAEKGIELTFDSVKALAAAALAQVLGAS